MPHFLSRGTSRRTFRVAVAIPFLTVILGLTACGGGGGGDSQLNNRAPGASGGGTPTSSESTTGEQTTENGAGPSGSSGNGVTETPSGGSARPIDKSGSEADDTVALPVELPDLPVSEVAGLVLLEWDRPDQRENGDYLEGDEIGGYELRYHQVGDDKARVILLDDPYQERIELADLVGRYQFSIAVFDTDGLYSKFVPLSPVSNLL
ncbi:hypothetical protein [Marinimicrobium sp. ARAG 43.8]|uniref:hypothetical protein n=1 Tax=Marinimicrobium sp. ARAG 43.8 TaxID=3418719 RepID=UPI003CED96D1